MSQESAASLAQRCAQAREIRPGIWEACCPAHEDRTPSLRIATGASGNVILKCFAGCAVPAIIAALDLAMVDIAPPNFQPTPTRNGTPPSQGARAYATWEANRADPAAPRLLTPEEVLGQLTDEDKLAFLLEEPDPQQWFTPTALGSLALYRQDPVRWGQICAKAQGYMVSPKRLEQAVDALGGTGTTSPPAGVLDIISMDAVKERESEWLWWPYFEQGVLALIDGDPGQGKSFLTLAMATHLSQGIPFPDQMGDRRLPVTPGPVLFFATEDYLDTAVKARLRRMGTFGEHIEFVLGVTSQKKRTRFTMKELPLLEAHLRERPYRLIVIDPIQSYIGQGVDMNKATDMDPVLDRLAQLAQEFTVTIICVRHMAKGEGSESALGMMRGVGSVGIAGKARNMVSVIAHPTDPDLSLMVQTKTSHGGKGRILLFSKANGVFAWRGVTRLESEVIAGRSKGPFPHERRKAAFWLERELGDGYARWAQDVLSDAREFHNLSEKVVTEARHAIGVHTRQVRHDGENSWEWRLDAIENILPPWLTTQEDPMSLGASLDDATTPYDKKDYLREEFNINNTLSLSPPTSPPTSPGSSQQSVSSASTVPTGHIGGSARLSSPSLVSNGSGDGTIPQKRVNSVDPDTPVRQVPFARDAHDAHANSAEEEECQEERSDYDDD